MIERDIFIEALQRPLPVERRAYLDMACAGDERLRARVEGLLAALGEAGSFLMEPTAAGMAAIGRALATGGTAPAPEGPGSIIGPYTLLESIGEGGMGVVYMAEQTHPVRRRVALKVIKPGMDTRLVLARFEVERQALALMEHPNIAKVHDAGATDSGRPYFVMELVQGIPITEYCDKARLAIPERLELFVLVCRAVQHAHQKGVIHRDLKPSNVLVTVIDGVAVPKVIDFGVAKTTGGPLTDRTLDTGFALLVGTPLYMSPEQAGLAGADVDTRSDVYALGVLLYELLTSTTPIDRATLLRASIDEVSRVVREHVPPAPSTRLATLGATLATVSADRQADARKLSQAVRGELDWIVMKALEKDRERRYETASDLAADVMRHLTGRPVEACPPSVSYQFRKYARRHRTALTTATLVGAALVAGTAISAWQAARAREAQLQANVAEARAATEAAIANAVNEFLRMDLLGQTNTLSRDGGGSPHLTVREALDRASARIGDRFRRQPLVEAAIRETIAASYRSLGEDRLAVPHLERAVGLRRRHLGPDHPNTVGSMSELSTAYRWAGRFPDAIALAREVVSRRASAHGRDHPDTLAAVNLLAEGFLQAGQLDVSGQLLESLLARQMAVCGPSHPSTLGTMHLLAFNHREAGRLAESLALHERVLRLQEAAYGRQHESTRRTLMSLAQLCQRVGDLDRADQLLAEALEIARNGDDTPRRRVDIANTRGWQAKSLLLRHQYTEAETLVREALAVFDEQRPEAPRRFYWMSLQGTTLCGLGRYAEAEPLLLRGYEGMKRQEAVLPVDKLHELAEAGEWVVRFYELTQQPRAACAWRERLAVAHDPG